MPRALRRTSWTVPRGWLVVAPVLLVVAVVGGFAVKGLADLRTLGESVDVAVSSMRSPVFDVVAVALDRLDTIPVVAAVMLVVCVVVGLTRSWRDAVAVGAITALAWSSSLVVKALVAQPRPPLPLGHGLPVHSTTLSYPSGHVAFVVVLAVVLACAVGRRARVPVLVAGALLAVVVGWSRLYLGLHYPTDLLGAGLLGVGAALLLCGVFAAILGRTRRSGR